MPSPSTSKTRRRVFRILLATAVASVLPLSTALPASAAPDDQANSRVSGPLVDYVNQFVGTSELGNSFPGATVPFGMVQLSPDNGHSLGYDYNRDRIRGFSMVHLSGVGCGLGGTLPILPTTGAMGSTNYGDYALKFSHANESAKPGYYQVGLEASAGTINAELTATEHLGVQRYTFPATTEANVLINTGQALNNVVSSSVKIIGNNVVETRITQKGFCGTTPEMITYARTEFSRPFVSFGTWDGGTVTDGSTATDGGGAGVPIYASTPPPTQWSNPPRHSAMSTKPAHKPT